MSAPPFPWRANPQAATALRLGGVTSVTRRKVSLCALLVVAPLA